MQPRNFTIACCLLLLNASSWAVEPFPIADPNGPYTASVGLSVQFDGSASSSPLGFELVAYDWDFGDGNTGAGVAPTHSYATNGVFTVTLQVTDETGQTGSATTTATIVVPNQLPVADPNGPYTGTVLTPVQFDGSGSYDPDGTLVAYDWDFGDGNTGTGVAPTHTYATGGTFTVTLRVTDETGETDSATTTATIGPEPVGVDANPGEAPDCSKHINVAVLGSVALDVTQVAPASLSFNGLSVSQKGNGQLRCEFEDVNGDGYLDLNCRYSDEETEGILTGNLTTGVPIQGSDTICVVRN